MERSDRFSGGQILRSDPQILRSSDPQILRSSDPQILRSSDPQILNSLNPQISTISEGLAQRLAHVAHRVADGIAILVAVAVAVEMHAAPQVRADVASQPLYFVADLGAVMDPFARVRPRVLDALAQFPPQFCPV